MLCLLLSSSLLFSSFGRAFICMRVRNSFVVSVEIFTSLSVLRNATLFKPFLSVVLELRICRFQMYIFPFTDGHLSVVHRPVTDRSPPGD